MKQFFRILTYILILSIIICYFLKSHLNGLDNISTASASDPVQKEIKNPEEISFEGDGFNYKATPQYDYTITGIVVSKKNYNTLGSDGMDKSVPYDLCIVWGDNASKEAYLSGIKFKQDQRFCFYSYSAGTKFYHEQLSNNHLLIRDDSIYKIEKSINVGDEIQIKGKLVNVVATKTDGSGKYFTWETSTVRTDSGAGACEVILVDSLNILQRANPIAFYGFIVSLYSLILIIIIRFTTFIFAKNL